MTKGILPQQSFGYDAYGNLTTDAEKGTAADVTTLSYDLADHLTGIEAAGTANDTTFTLDALGRFATRTVGGTTDTYSYVDTSEVVTRIAGATTTDSIVSPAGDRLGVKVGSTIDWFVPDPHGSIAGSLDATEATVVSAIRYDAWGGTLATGSAGGSPVGADLWKYGGRLDVSPAGLDSPLYDMSARFYAPGLAAFTQFDSVMGSAQDPLSMNRFLYAQADPTTLIDPTGHDGFDPFGFVGQVAGNAGNFALGAGEGFVGTFIDAGAGIISAGSGAIGCAASDSCRRQAVAAAGAGVTAFVRDPVKVTTRAASAAVDIGAKAVGSAVDRVGKAWSSGNFRELGKVTGEIGAAVIPVGGVVAKVGLAAKGITEVANAGRFLRGASELAAAGRVARLSDGIASRLRGIARACVNSFTPTTLVLTSAGLVPIAALAVGDTVLAEDPASGQVIERTITATHRNDDPVTGTVAIDDESIETTPEHPFYTVERGWTDAQDLRPGDHVPSADGSLGAVRSVRFDGAPAVMYNLTVAVDHTFFVGNGEWLVHNANCGAAKWDPEIGRWRDPGSGRFASGPAASQVVIGESSDRVLATARRLSAEGTPTAVYRPRPGLNPRLNPRDFEIAKSRNTRWINGVMRSGKLIIDRGLDSRRAARGPFYALERAAIISRGYSRILRMYD